MDTTQKYIDMCREATEIQDSKPYPYDDMSEAWLPRQDQLQEMVDLHKFPYLAVQQLANAHCGGPLSNYHMESMEQLWLSYVMYRKYGKVWQNSGWHTEAKHEH